MKPTPETTPVEYWRWYIPDASRKDGKRPSRWRMTEADAAARGLAEKVPGSREVRGDPWGGDPANYSSPPRHHSAMTFDLSHIRPGCAVTLPPETASELPFLAEPLPREEPARALAVDQQHVHVAVVGPAGVKRPA